MKEGKKYGQKNNDESIMGVRMKYFVSFTDNK